MGNFHEPGYAKIRTHLDFIQLDPRNAPCHVTSTPDTEYTITDDVHHLLVDYAPPPVMISATCGGSRRFVLHVVVSWLRKPRQDRCGLRLTRSVRRPTRT